MKIADLYIRVSTDEQADKGYSQRDQKDVLTKYCEINSIIVRDVIFEDHSAKTFERPQWKKLLAHLKKYKGKSELVLFTKWDRFSRNASDAYQMISILRKIGVEPQAIEQPLDMNIPENKMMLAVYLTAPEIENDRRALNVKHGMRQAKKEGRWMGTAPPGYANKINENGRKYIAISEPQASYIRWAFQKIVEGPYCTKDVWKMARDRGLSCNLNSFWSALRNVCYYGKIKVPAYKNEETHMVQGTHEPLISESLFYDIQDVLNGRQKGQAKNGVTIASHDKLPLRGFLHCPNCNRVLTGSASKGRNEYYYYYHCKSVCGWRQKAEKVNAAFLNELKRFIPKPGMSELYREVISDLYKDDKRFEQEERKQLIVQITENNNRITKARELLLNEAIDQIDYKFIKKEAEDKTLRFEAKLNDFKSDRKNSVDIEGLINKALENLKNLDLLYLNADIDAKREIIGSIFTEKWSFDGTQHRTKKINEAALLIYQINSQLGHKKIRIRTKNRSQSGYVHPIGFEPMTYGLENRCSIQLSYGCINGTKV
jgi:site-specific DNA recombinase